VSPPGLAAVQENDFITYQNSQLVFMIGSLSYDFGTEARRDYFLQEFDALFRLDPNAAEFRDMVGLPPDKKDFVPYPENHLAMVVYLDAYRMLAKYRHDKKPPDDREVDAQYNSNLAAANALIWTLTVDGIAVYEIRPTGNFDDFTYTALIGMLRDQTVTVKSEFGDKEEPIADRMSVAGRLIGSKRLYNGTIVPTIDPTLRGMHNWRKDLLGRSAREAIEDQLAEIDRNTREEGGEVVDEDLQKEQTRLRTLRQRLEDGIDNFLDRVYYELRNLGLSPSDRAINYMAVNAFGTGQAFADAIARGMDLDSIEVEPSPICRPESLCYDVIYKFFNPLKKDQVAMRFYRQTVDVSDVVPVNVGPMRQWYEYDRG